MTLIKTPATGSETKVTENGFERITAYSTIPTKIVLSSMMQYGGKYYSSWKQT